MTEQPEVPQVEQEQQVEQVEQPPQAPPPFQKKGMRFFVRLNDLPSSKTYQQPLSLHRFELRGDGQLVMERFDKNERKWVWNPSTIEFTGIGGDESMKEIDEEEANRLIAMWTPGEEEVEEADAEPVPEEETESTGITQEMVDEFTNKPDLEKVRELPMREQTGEDQSDLLFDFLGKMGEEVEETTEQEEEKPDAEKTVGERKQEMEDEKEKEEVERTFSLRGLLRRILNV